MTETLAAGPVARHQQSAIGFLIPLVLVGPLSMDVYLPALAMLKSYFGVSAGLVQWTLSVFLLGFGCTQLLVGEFSTRFGRHRTIVIGSAVYLLSTLACALSGDVYSLIGFRFLQALGACCCMVLAMASVQELSSDVEESTHSFSMLAGATAVAPIVAPIGGSFLIEAFGSWQSVFYSLALFMLFAYGLYLWRVRAHILPPRSDGSVGASYWDIARDKKFWSFALFNASGMSMIFLFFSLSPGIIIEQYGLGTKAYSLMFGACASSFLAGNLMGPKLAARFGLVAVLVGSYRALILLGIVLAAVSLLVPSLESFVGLMMCVELGIGLSFGTAMSGAMMNYKEASDRAAAIHGFQQFLISFLIGTSVVLMGYTSAAAMGTSIMTLAAITLIIHAKLRK